MDKAKKTARTLYRANRKMGLSWRVISKHGYMDDDVIIQPGINPTTLCRFAKSKGTWQPIDINILKLLGLYHEKQAKPKSIFEMSVIELLYCLRNREAARPGMTQKQLNDYVHACRVASKARKTTP